MTAKQYKSMQVRLPPNQWKPLTELSLVTGLSINKLILISIDEFSKSERHDQLKQNTKLSSE